MQAVSSNLIDAIAVTAELTNTTLTRAAAKVMALDLAAYPEPQILGALTRCRRELRGSMTIADVLTRIDDGRPGPEEAWAMVPKDEVASAVITDEMATAMGVAGPLMDAPIQARMAFLESYRSEIRKAREERRPVHWFPCLGHDPQGRGAVLLQAVEQGRITPGHAQSLLGNAVHADVVARIAAMGGVRALVGKK